MQTGGGLRSSVETELAGGAWVRLVGFLGLLVAIVHLVGFRSDPTGTLAGIDWVRHRAHTDHVAHVGEARILPRLGLDTWRVPAQELFRRLTPAEVAELPADVKAYTLEFPEDTRLVPGYPPERPLVTNYPHVPRIYPPAAFLIGAPSALLYHYGLISFGASNRLYLAILVCAWLAAVLAWTSWWRVSPPSPIRQVLTAVAVGYSWYWAMEGFYDVLAVATASVAFQAARRRQHGLAALLAGFAVSLHPRLFMLLPLFGAIFWAAGRAWAALAARARAATLLGVLLVAGACVYVVLIQRVLSLHAVVQPPNPVRPGVGPWPAVVGYFFVLAAVSAQLFRHGSRLDGVAALFGGLAFASQRYLAPWYWLPLLPWALAPERLHSSATPTSKRGAIARVLVVAMCWLACVAPRW
jgi:hypothetical protein